MTFEEYWTDLFKNTQGMDALRESFREMAKSAWDAARREDDKKILEQLQKSIDLLDSRNDIDLYKEALVWAVGYLPPTCPGHFMHLLIEAKEKADKLNGV